MDYHPCMLTCSGPARLAKASAVRESQPASGLLALVWLIGLYAIVVGIFYLVPYF